MSDKIDVLDKGFVRLVDSMGNDAAIVQAARVSYGAGTKQVSEDRGLIRYLLRHKHTTPFEMVEFKFHCKMPIFVARQWIRHRTASVNEVSGRYSVMKNEFYVPEESVVTFQNPNNKQGGTDEVVTPFNIKNPDDWWDCMTAEQVADSWDWKSKFSNEQEMVANNYNRLVNSGMRKELARINLPLSTYTEWYWKMDLHNLLHFLKLRLDTHAQYEIRVYAQAILELIRPVVPLAVEAFEDYSLNAMSLSRLDLDCLYAVLQDSGEGILAKLQEQAEILFENKREREEFVQKCTSLIKR